MFEVDDGCSREGSEEGSGFSLGKRGSKVVPDSEQVGLGELG